MLSHLIFIIIISLGMAILLVEKGHSYPMRFYNVKIRRIIRKITKKIGKKYKGRRFEEVLYCVTCTSFWMAFFVDFVMFFYDKMFLWPASGFATAGICYIIFELLNVLEKK